MRHTRFSLGDSGGAEEHLMLAKEFGASNSQIQEIRRSGRAIQRMDLEKDKPKPLKEKKTNAATIRLSLSG